MYFYDLDERIIKTRIALSGALFEMIKENKNIKVLDVCRKANITPMTYYHHFHNRTQLIDYAIRMQLQNILPIPKKWKPINVKHLVFYLIKHLSYFMLSNQRLIYSSLVESNQSKYNKSYIYYLEKIVNELVKEELKLLIHNNNTLVELWNNIICGCLFKTFLSMVINNSFIKDIDIYQLIKDLLRKLL